ncbi:MAG: RNA 3'-terminal phosphate cyclase, partial [Armatimonadia bacterium]
PVGGTMTDSITIDGSKGEGGGQMLRTSLSVAAVAGQPVRLINIRAGRAKPGLAAQHLTSCRAVAEVCGGKLAGAEIGSQQVELHPGPVTGGEYHFDIGTAGSTSLLLQAVLPPLLFAASPSHLVLHGGTDVPWSPIFHYLDEVFLPTVRQMGVSARLECRRHGWYPAGGGEVQAWIEPLQGPLQALQWTQRGETTGAVAHSLVSEKLPMHIAQRQCQGLQEALGKCLALPCEQHHEPSHSHGTTCFAAVRFASGAGGFTSLGERGKPAEQVGVETGEALQAFLNLEATVDERLADQLLLYAILAQGRSAYLSPRLTGHLETNAWVIEQLLHVGTEFEYTSTGTLVEVQGLGLS